MNNLLENSGILIQPFMHQVINSGELSLIFLGGEFSHGVLKQPKSGDFRAISDYGASETFFIPDKIIINQARKILDKVGKELLYARIDGIIEDGKFILTELELIEPELFFHLNSSSPQRFVEALYHKASQGNIKTG